MQPTLNPDHSLWRDIAIFNKVTIQAFHNYRRGDIVALKPPSNKGPMLVKRILALPGDRVQTLPPYPDQVVTVPPGHAWVEGDDQWRSKDSNHFGPVPLGLIESKLSWIIWPFARFGPVKPSRPLAQGIIEQSNTWSPTGREQWRWSRVEIAASPNTKQE